MSPPPRLHLIDGTYELFRAHFSPRPGHTSPEGQDVKGVAGLMGSLLALLHDPAEAVSHAAAAFDNPIRSFRNALFDGYKTEEGVPPELLAQFDLAEEAVAALGLRVWRMGDYEADDALATAAARFASEVSQVRLLTPDKDLSQCVVGERVVQVDRMRERVLDEAAVRALRGVAPESVPDLLALVGDAADGIPGLPGFGEKGAATLLAAYVHLEAIPADAAQWSVRPRGADKLAATLRERREDALLYRRLATLVTDAPLPGTPGLDSLAWKGVPRAPFEALCSRLGLERLRTRPQRWA
ncbi:flap endonuclease [Aggregicoccus sp. 17bor-14]|uniref:5'-3' exonuclease n=1 Tax=Myxococcaceae TaxID=31 RepID=UPI0012EFE420|nr:flap endonuclease [Simulacricoccus sp. 17bor-14]MRI91987.1 flap endonuclease [Aggregicoccus sp. 17bor-14]